MANTVQELSAVVQGVRRQHGISQADLALKAGLSRKFISEFEAGKDTVELGRVLALMDALGIEVTLRVLGTDPVPAISGLQAELIDLDWLMADYQDGQDGQDGQVGQDGGRDSQP